MLFTILLVLVLLGLAIWGIGFLPFDATILNLMKLVAVAAAVFYLWRFL